MSNTRFVQTPKLPDATLFNIFDDLAATLGASATYRLFVSQGDQLSSERLEKMGLGVGTTQVEYATTNGRGISVAFNRGVRGQQGQSIRLPSISFDEIEVSVSDHQPDIDLLVKVNQKIERTIASLTVRTPLGEPSELSSLIQNSHAQLNALLSEISQRYDEREKRAEAHRATLEQDYLRMRERLEADAEQRRIEFEERDTDLRARAKELDDRDNTHVRRELRAKITETLRLRLKEPLTSPSTKLNSFAFMFGCVIVGSGLIYFGLESQRAVSIATKDTAMWFAIIKSTLLSAAGIGFFGYGVSWLRKLYLDDSRLERGLERYALDLDRASWAIETIIEVSKKEGAELPSAWVQGVCRDLFVMSSEKDDPTALQALGAIMDVASGAEIGSDGAKITLNRRGTKAVAQSGR